jgi:hypothetical protein
MVTLLQIFLQTQYLSCNHEPNVNLSFFLSIFILGGEFGKRRSLCQQKQDREELDSMLKLAVTKKSVQESAVLLPFDLVTWIG